MTRSSQIRFVADRMLGRLAKMLRLLGYDTIYSPRLVASELEQVARGEDRVLLTRGNTEKRFPTLDGIFSLRSDSPAEQFRKVVKQFTLDARAGLWTRCTLCNAPIQKVEKAAVKSRVAPQVFEIYEEFFRCSGCGHIYWQGSHAERILKNLERILKE